jgi:predicted RNase H-like HicB family nuclease
MPKYSITIQYDNADNIYVASVPELEGCMAHGKTPEEAAKEIQVAIKGWLKIAEERGMVIPEPLIFVS